MKNIGKLRCDRKIAIKLISSIEDVKCGQYSIVSGQGQLVGLL
jgi:hypothetical protein